MADVEGAGHAGTRTLKRQGGRRLSAGVILLNGKYSHPDWFTNKAGLHVVMKTLSPGRSIDMQTDGLLVRIAERVREPENLYVFTWEFAPDIPYEGKREGMESQKDPHYYKGEISLTREDLARAFLGSAWLAAEDAYHAVNGQWDCTDWGHGWIRLGQCLNIPMAFPGPLCGAVSFALYPNNKFQPAIREVFPEVAELEQYLD